ncbi:MAG: heavy metal translocating P-type ATPase [Planctomycetaceae bacterium]|nr:heavy metal translocating P-type ATPase [Planctomycetaceae bacterium]
MDCAEEVTVLKNEVGPVVGGVEYLTFDVLRSRMTVLPSAVKANANEILAAVARTGMRADVWQDDEASNGEVVAGQLLSGRLLTTSISGLAIVAAILTHAASVGSLQAGLGIVESTVPWTARLLYLVAVIAGGWYVAPKAWHALSRLRPDMNLLMLVAVLGAMRIGEWFEAAAVALLFSVSLLLESWSVGRARRAVAALLDLTPPTVRLRGDNGKETSTSPDEVDVGATFIVKPGERIPLDGEVVEGRSDVNQAPITGESVPVSKEPGATVFAGTINGDGAIVVRSTKSAGQTTLAGIIRMVGEAHSRKAPSEQWVESFARYYTPAVMVLALLVFFLPPLLLGQPWERWFYSALVLLVIACPCALVISTPVSIVASLAAAARNGVLIKGGVFVEAPSRLKAIALDKTGTLTEGKPSVVEVVPLSGHTEQELLERALALELRSEHPLARAIVRHAQGLGIAPSPADDAQIIQGKGVSGHFNGRLFWLGSHRYLEEREQETPEMHERLNELAGSGRSVVVVGNDSHVCGFIALTDEVRPTVRDTLQALRERGIEHLIMLTGDNAPTANAVAERIGIDEVRAELLPEDKISAIEELVARYEAVAMIGDGVNDAPALARATIGIAMGAAGTDAAIETADIALMTDDLSRLPWLVQHSRRTLAIIRQNIAFSLAIKLLFVALTFAGTASLWAAIAADMGASLLVIFNGLRLLNASSR